MRLAAAAALGALVLAAGCSHVPPTIGDPAPTLPDLAAEESYRQVFERHSGRGEVYALFDTRLFAGATLQTWSFREARVRRQAAFQQLSPAEAERLLAEERAASDKAHEVFLGVHVNEHQYDDFDRPDSIWHLALVTSEGEVDPLRVERIGRADLDMRAYYPYLGTFWVAYRVRFPRTTSEGRPVLAPGAQVVRLRIASTLGSTELKLGTD